MAYLSQIDINGTTYDLKDKFALDTINYFNKYTVMKFIDGSYIKLDISSGININSPVGNAGYRYAVAECEYGDWCEIHTNGAGAARAFAFVDANGDRLAAASANTDIDAIYIAPPNAKYLVINDKIADTDYSGHIGTSKKQQQNIDNIIKNIETRIINQIPINPLDLQFEYGRYTIYANDMAYYCDYPSTLNNRIRLCPQTFIFLPKGTQIKTDGTTQFFNIIKNLDGTFTSNQWTTELTLTENAYYLFSMRYPDDSSIANISLVASTLEIIPPKNLSTLEYEVVS